MQNFLGFASGVDTLVINNKDTRLLTHQYFLAADDKDGRASIERILNSSSSFHTISSSVPVLKGPRSATWLKIILKNNTNQLFIPISIRESIIDEFDVYYNDDAVHHIIHLAANFSQQGLNFLAPDITLINCPVLPGSAQIVYLRIKSNAPVVVPIQVHSAEHFLQNRNTENIIVGAIIGIIIVMALYNLLLFIVVRDVSYLYYVAYLSFLGISQLLIRGYCVSWFTNYKPFLNSYIIPLFRVFFGYSVLLFVGEFLQLKYNIKRYYNYYKLLYGLYTLTLITVVAGYTALAYNLMTVSIFTTTIILLFIGILLYLRGFKPAKYFMMGWGVFLLTILVAIAHVRGIIPYNVLTDNVVIFGSLIEIILFSTALADKINFYRRQNAESQSAALVIAKENERLITGQNIILENKVKERTLELLETNQNLSQTIENLKETQKQLVNTEKMASLGQLTAGVAHEINNPINFVSSNIKPLRLDFNELFELINKYEEALNRPESPELLIVATAYSQKINVNFVKDEILTLLTGIEEGANRTAEIVQSLRIFSRTDELTLKTTDINKTILGTLVILRNNIPHYIEIKTDLQQLPLLNCYPGKINQLLINLITNSIQAINARHAPVNESISIKTFDEKKHIRIEVADTGPGMPDDIKKRIFEPFFTTKNVGEGTGLGLSIVFGIIEKHKGTIDVRSAEGTGTTFIITLPKNLQ
ncbi:7TM diverse intracellular signaling domain-containing protein [soil metagenome]|jgi:two-component system NtrC family sensor kinase